LTRIRLVALVAFAVLAAACAATFGVTVEALVDIAGCGVLVAVTVTDLERRIVPNRIIVPALVVALVVQTARDPSPEWILAALAAGGFFLLAALVHPAGLGMGDVKMAAFLGAWLGKPVLVALFAGALIAMIPALAILARHGGAGRKVGIPFAPFLAAGGVVALFFGDAIMVAWLG
jgi:leader peptidase (prepilin peptidase)/N-methyltransferase